MVGGPHTARPPAACHCWCQLMRGAAAKDTCQEPRARQPTFACATRAGSGFGQQGGTLPCSASCTAPMALLLFLYRTHTPSRACCRGHVQGHMPPLLPGHTPKLQRIICRRICRLHFTTLRPIPPCARVPVCGRSSWATAPVARSSVPISRVQTKPRCQIRLVHLAPSQTRPENVGPRPSSLSHI